MRILTRGITIRSKDQQLLEVKCRILIEFSQYFDHKEGAQNQGGYFFNKEKIEKDATLKKKMAEIEFVGLKIQNIFEAIFESRLTLIEVPLTFMKSLSVIPISKISH